MKPSPELRGQLQEMLAKGRRALASAQRDFNAGDHDFASSRAYYAAFYAIEALLLTQDITSATHSGAISGFGRHFVATGLFPKDFGKRIARLFRERQTGDYGFGMSITEADAQEDLAHARTIVDAADVYLTGEGYFSFPSQ